MLQDHHFILAKIGATHGMMIGHVSPEAMVGGPIGLIKNGDINHLIEALKWVAKQYSSGKAEDSDRNLGINTPIHDSESREKMNGKQMSHSVGIQCFFFLFLLLLCWIQFEIILRNF